jgi:hypothetical protein
MLVIVVVKVRDVTDGAALAGPISDVLEMPRETMRAVMSRIRRTLTPLSGVN